MTISESLERQLDDALKSVGPTIRSKSYFDWRELGLEELIKYAEKERHYWELNNYARIKDDIVKVIGIARALQKIKKEEK